MDDTQQTDTPEPYIKQRYLLRWRLSRTSCPGPQELVSEVIEAGKPAPESVMVRWVAGVGYAVCVGFLDDKQIGYWSDERKATTRRRNLERRVNRIASLFADELIKRELEIRLEYFQGETMNMPPKEGESCWRL